MKNIIKIIGATLLGLICLLPFILETIESVFLFFPFVIVGIFYYFVKNKRQQVDDDIKLLYAICLSSIVGDILAIIIVLIFTVPMISIILQSKGNYGLLIIMFLVSILPFIYIILLLNGTNDLKHQRYKNAKIKLSIYFFSITAISLIFFIINGFENFQELLNMVILFYALYKLITFKL